MFAVGGLLALLELLALIDPAGAKMADDAAPFGDPRLPWYQHATLILITALLVGVGCRLLRAKGERRDEV